MGKVAQKVPGRVQEVVADIRFAPGRLTTNWTGSIDEALNRCQRRNARACRHPVLYIRQYHRQLLFRYRYSPMLRAINDWNGRPPVTLPTDEPVAQAIPGNTFADATLFKPGSNGISSL